MATPTSGADGEVMASRVRLPKVDYPAMTITSSVDFPQKDCPESLPAKMSSVQGPILCRVALSEGVSPLENKNLARSWAKNVKVFRREAVRTVRVCWSIVAAPCLLLSRSIVQSFLEIMVVRLLSPTLHKSIVWIQLVD